MKVLCVAEKPSVAKSVAAILSSNQFQTTPTRNKYIKNYRFRTDFEGRNNCDIVMTALLGHLFELEFREDFRKWHAMQPSGCFTAPIVKYVKDDMKSVRDNIATEARGAEVVVIWTDCDLEGENIGSEVVKVCREVNPRIRVRRAKFSVIQEREIRLAWNRLVDLDVRQAEAVDVRQELDLRIGAAFTRLQTLGLQEQLDHKQVLSYGTCQFPTLGFIVDQYERRTSFTPEPFWKIELTLAKDGASQLFSWRRGWLFDHDIAVALYQMCFESPAAVITSANSRPTEKWRPLPLTTVEMLKACSSRLRISSDRAMRAAESLYLQGYISYPRTETDVFEPVFNLKDLIKEQVGNRNWGEFAQGLLDGSFRFPRGGQHNDQAHPPIHPTKSCNLENGDESRVYEYITRRFLACCADNAKGQLTTVEASVAEETFSASGLVIVERNYLDVFPYDKWAESTVPNFRINERIEPQALILKQGSTTPPSMLTEAELIAKMEAAGVGTDATIHDHIKKILDREYANKEEGKFLPSTLGMGLVQGYKNMEMELSLSKPYMRSQMESNMKSIADGRRHPNDILQETLQVYSHAFREAENKFDRMQQALQQTMEI